MSVPFTQDAAGLLLEAVAGLLAIPDGPGQRKLASHPVLADGSQGPSPQLLRLDVVRLEPESLQLGMILWRKLVALQDLVQVLEVPSVEGDHRLGLEHTFVLVQVLTGRQRPQKPS